MLERMGEINLKSILRVLTTGTHGHVKKRSNVRLVREFALRGVLHLRDEVEVLKA
jgi:hypothetical protein